MSPLRASLGKPRKVAVTLRIERLRASIARERAVSLAALGEITPRLARLEHLLSRLRALPAVVRRYAPYLIPFMSVVFRKNRLLRLCIRAWGLVRVGKMVARVVWIARRQSVPSAGMMAK